VTVDTLVRLWGFGPNKVIKAPTTNEIKEVLKYVGMAKLTWDDKKVFVTKSHPNLKLDFSSIAKGRGVDRVLNLLQSKYTFSNVLVEIGGEVSARGKNKHDQYWSVGVEMPAEELGSGVAKVIELNNQSIATSGSYRNLKKYNNKKYSHTIDPKTGQPIESDLISVSVIAADCTTADAWATALMAMGSKTALNKANELKLKVIMLFANELGTVDIVESELMKVK
jgi:thiamine biosynthesis lipoprotein